MNNQQQPVKHVFGLESSCDDTGAAIVNSKSTVLANCIASQLKSHNLNGGIIPMLAKEYHVGNVDEICKTALGVSKLESFGGNIDAIAVSTRPGLQYSLNVGLNYCKTLAKKYSKPLIPVHHMQAHALMPLLEHKQIRFPFMALLISGGHCLLTIAKRYDEFHLLGVGLDEAPGDALDKFARRANLKNLGPPFDVLSGGAAIERLASMDGADRFKYFNRPSGIPMLQQQTCNFSFSGYRSSWESLIPMIDTLWRFDRAKLVTELGHICASLQRVFLVQLIRKLNRAIMYYRMFWRYENTDAFQVTQGNRLERHLGYELLRLGGQEDNSGAIDVLVSGGVACNQYLVNGIRDVCNQVIDQDVKVYSPSRKYCSDNGLMIAWNGLLRFQDYQTNKEKFTLAGLDLNDSVISDANLIDSIREEAISPIGRDITDKVALASISLRRPRCKEINLRNEDYWIQSVL